MIIDDFGGVKVDGTKSREKVADEKSLKRDKNTTPFVDRSEEGI